MNPRLEKLVEALESGSYKQGRVMLHRRRYYDDAPEDLYCVLGVACEVYIEETGDYRIKSKQLHGGSYMYGGGVSALPLKVKDWYGFKTVYGGEFGSSPSLVGLNDGSAESRYRMNSFEEIAQYIRANSENLVDW